MKRFAALIVCLAVLLSWLPPTHAAPLFCGGFDFASRCSCNAANSALTAAAAINDSEPTAVRLAGNCATTDVVVNRNFQWQPTAVRQFLTTAYDGRKSHMTLDAQNRPVRIHVPSQGNQLGLSITFQWTSATAAVVSITDSDGNFQATSAIDFSAPLNDEPIDFNILLAGASAEPLTNLRQNLAPRGGVAPTVSFHPAHTLAGTDEDELTSLNRQLAVSVNSCGTPTANSHVVGSYNTISGPRNVVGTPTGNGNFLVPLPQTDPLPGNNAQSVCHSVLDPLNNACTLYSNSVGMMPYAGAHMCLSLAYNMARIPNLIPLIPKVSAACGVAFVVADVTCTLVENHTVSAACSAARALADPAPGITFLFSVSASAPGVPATPGSTRNLLVPASGALEPVSLSFGSSETRVDQLTTVPIDPAPGQSYVGHADLICGNPGDLLMMRVLGTDGYEDTVVCPSITGGGRCSMYVPGAIQGVEDVVTVTRNGVPIRNISLVF